MSKIYQFATVAVLSLSVVGLFGVGITHAQSAEQQIQLNGLVGPGDRGEQVRQIQQLLAQDSDIYPEGLVTGYYGDLTAQAVSRLQAEAGLPQVGRVGQETLNYLLSVSGSSEDTSSAGLPSPPDSPEVPETTTSNPNAEITVNPSTNVDVGQQLTVDASGSSDPDGDQLTYFWSVDTPRGSGNTDGFISLSGIQTSFEQSGTATFEVTVRDSDGNTDSASITVQIGSGGGVSDNAEGKKVSFWCGKVNQHTEDGEWVTDSDGVSGCPSESAYTESKLNYCRKFYPDTDEVQPAGQARISGWKNQGNSGSFSATRPTYECVDNDSESTEDEFGTCPFEQGDGDDEYDSVFTFSKDWVRSDKERPEAVADSKDVGLEPGDYRVGMSSNDSGEERKNQSQRSEQFFVHFSNSETGFSDSTVSTDDLEDEVESASDTKTTRITLEKAISQLQVRHSSFFDKVDDDNSANSVGVGCVAVDKRSEQTDSPTDDPTPEPPERDTITLTNTFRDSFEFTATITRISDTQWQYDIEGSVPSPNYTMDVNANGTQIMASIKQGNGLAPTVVTDVQDSGQFTTDSTVSADEINFDVQGDSQSDDSSDDLPPAPENPDLPADDSQSEPTASITASPSTTVNVGQELTIDASGSSDPDGDQLTYDWVVDTPRGAGERNDYKSSISMSFEQTGTAEFEVTVRDGNGNSDSASVAVEVVNPTDTPDDTSNLPTPEVPDLPGL